MVTTHILVCPPASLLQVETESRPGPSDRCGPFGYRCCPTVFAPTSALQGLPEVTRNWTEVSMDLKNLMSDLQNTKGQKSDEKNHHAGTYTMDELNIMTYTVASLIFKGINFGG